ncbi:MAG: ABC transporter permease [Balneolaceae bacterium]
MIKNYLRVIFRTIQNHPVYTLVNLAGLAIGITCAVYIGLFIWDELGYDRHHTNGDDIYRISQRIAYESGDAHLATTPFPLAETLEAQYPAFVQNAVRFFDMETPAIAIGNNDEDLFFREENFFFADAQVLDVFDINLLRGNPETALVEPASVIITPAIAERYFGDEDPVGQSLVYDGMMLIHVTGVMEPWPRQSHFHPELIASFTTLREIWRNYDAFTAQWGWNPLWTYILMQPGADADRFEEQIQELTGRYYAEYFGETETVTLELQPLRDIYLHSDLDGEIARNGSYTYVLIFSIVGLLILAIACINYINLSTARSVQRSKEVGLRKTMGADKVQLIRQFLFESLIYSAGAVVASAILFVLAEPYFQMLTGKSVTLLEFGYATVALIVVLMALLVTIAAGFYPALFLSSYNPVEGVRGTFTKGRKGGSLRRSLVVFQFAVTAMLLIGTSLAYLQYQLLETNEMGFDTEQVVAIPSSNRTMRNFDTLKEQFKSHSGVLEVSGTQTLMGSDLFYKYQVVPEGYGEQEAFAIAKMHVDYDFPETMGVGMLAGRPLSEEFATDREQAVMINRSMVEFMEWGPPQEALGKRFRYGGRDAAVVGVTENFHFAHLGYELEPLIMDLPLTPRHRTVNIDYVKVRLGTGDPAPALAHMKQAWDEMDRTHPFEFFFLDEKINEMYASERQFSSVMAVFALLAMFIGCIGLLGLASYAVHQRTKEIGIRKALGASAASIFILLSKESTRLIVIAHVIALPLIYLLARRGLEAFPYAINLNSSVVVVFLLSLFISVVISLSAISAHAIKAARIHPVESLQQE